MRRALLVLVFLLAAAAPCRRPAAGARRQRGLARAWQGFGGFSGIVVEDGGADFLTISDRGNWARGSMERTSDGRLEAAHLTDKGPILDQRGRRLRGQSFDAEGLAMDVEGPRLRLLRGRGPDPPLRRPARRRRPRSRAIPISASFRSTSGLEALAVDADGTLYAIPERTPKPDEPFPVYRFRDGPWDKPFRIPHRGDFHISDADRRSRRQALRARARVLLARLPLAGSAASTSARTGSTTRRRCSTSRLNQLDNMEGISVWTDPQGQIRVTLISDDNFFALQRTMFAEYILDES